jgi:hypothetical protein
MPPVECKKMTSFRDNILTWSKSGWTGKNHGLVSVNVKDPVLSFPARDRNALVKETKQSYQLNKDR